MAGPLKEPISIPEYISIKGEEFWLNDKYTIENEIKHHKSSILCIICILLTVGIS